MMTADTVPKALRKAYKEVRSENRMLKERVEELEARNVESQSRSEPDSGPRDEIDELLESQGLPAEARELISEDMEPEAWVKRYGNLFAEREQPSEPELEPTQPARKVNLTPEQIDQLRGVTEIQPGRASLNSGRPNLGKLDSASNLDEALEMLGEQGLRAPDGSSVGSPRR